MGAGEEFSNKRFLIGKVIQPVNYSNVQIAAIIFQLVPLGESILTKLTEKLMTPWFVAEINGKIANSHCNCKVGWRQTCFHIASLLIVDSSCWSREEKFVDGDTKEYLLGDVTTRGIQANW